MFVAINISTNLPALEECSQQKRETCYVSHIKKKKKKTFLHSILFQHLPFAAKFHKRFVCLLCL